MKTERSGWIPVGRKFLDCIHAQLKTQVTGLQNATEIKLNPEISVITRYKNIQLVKLNKAWISRLIMAAWTHIRLFSVGISQFCVCGWWFNFKSIWIYLLALDAGSQCKVGVSWEVLWIVVFIFSRTTSWTQESIWRGQSSLILKKVTVLIAFNSSRGFEHVIGRWQRLARFTENSEIFKKKRVIS